MYVLYFPYLGYRLLQLQDSYPWTNCNAFESTKKNCPRGEACLKLKNHKSYAWNWAMRCKLLEKFLNSVFDLNLNLF